MNERLITKECDLCSGGKNVIARDKDGNCVRCKGKNTIEVLSDEEKARQKKELDDALDLTYL